jgi:hypothetical protein
MVSKIAFQSVQKYWARGRIMQGSRSRQDLDEAAEDTLTKELTN